uniref:EF-hand domain-containing protein n=1 Tax=Phytophthora ramorum TaxID=164328 RepID=H3HD23_PHYRM
MLHEQPRQLTNGLFEAVGLAREIRRLRFDDFVLCVATIATWSKSELIHYAFKQFDVDKSGLMDGRELRAFCEGLKNDSSFYFAKNVNTAREKLALRDRKQLNNQIDTNFEDNTLVDIEDLAKGSTEFQVAFYPLMQLQQNMST